MRKVKIYKKLSKLKHIECSDMDCKCLESEEFVVVDDLKGLINKYKFDEKIFFIRLLQHLGLVKILNTQSNEKMEEQNARNNR